MNANPTKARIAKAKRDRSGSAKSAKNISWRVVRKTIKAFEAAQTTEEMARLGHLLVQALGTHGRLVEVADLADRLRLIEVQLETENHA
jgi:hypothetical protein